MLWAGAARASSRVRGRRSPPPLSRAAAGNHMNNSRRVSVSAVIGAMGIVYGDIGTSPLYAMQSALGAAGTFNRRSGAGRACR